MNILFDWINRKEGFFYFSIYTLVILRDSENIFLAVDAVSKLIERVSSLRTTIELFHFTFRRCTFMNCSNCSRLETPRVYFLSSYPFALTFHVHFEIYIVLRLPLHCGAGLLFMQPFPRIICALEKYGGSLRSLIFTVLRVYVRFKIFTKRSLCLHIRLLVNLK